MRYITTGYASTPPTGVPGVADHSWQRRAACNGLDPDEADALYFPSPRDITAITEAKQICSRCPVRQTCLTAALDNDTRHGIWGGLTEQERKPLHEKSRHRLDYARLHALFAGRDVALSQAERIAVARHAYTRGWSADRLAHLLRIAYDYARDLLRAAHHDIAARDRCTQNHRRTTPSPAKTQPPLRHQPHTQALLDELGLGEAA